MIERGLRVFLSYAHADREVVERIDAILQDLDFIPVWDKNIAAGKEFDDEIRVRIARSHIFMPLLTTNSKQRPWVHQEIGYSLGIDVPVVPIAVGVLPDGMISGVQAIRVQDDLSDLRSGLQEAGIASLLQSSHAVGDLGRLGITTHVADHGEERTRFLVGSAKNAVKPSWVRQRAIFSSFSLPNRDPGSGVWDTIELSGRRSEYSRALLREERRVLEEHAVTGGCSLILSPFQDFSSVGASVHRAQLGILRDFIESMPEELIRVAIIDGHSSGNLTIIGDWFGAMALPPQPGAEYRQTVFSHHAPTVLRWVRGFDRELEDLLHRAGIEASESRDYALRRIDDRIAELMQQE